MRQRSRRPGLRDPERACWPRSSPGSTRCRRPVPGPSSGAACCPSTAGHAKILAFYSRWRALRHFGQPERAAGKQYDRPSPRPGAERGPAAFDGASASPARRPARRARRPGRGTERPSPSAVPRADRGDRPCGRLRVLVPGRGGTVTASSIGSWPAAIPLLHPTAVSRLWWIGHATSTPRFASTTDPALRRPGGHAEGWPGRPDPELDERRTVAPLTMSARRQDHLRRAQLQRPRHGERSPRPDPAAPLLEVRQRDHRRRKSPSSDRQGTHALDLEVELGVVIGTTARRVGARGRAGPVAGYLVINDISARDWQGLFRRPWRRARSVTASGFGRRARTRSCRWVPCSSPPDEVRIPQKTCISARIASRLRPDDGRRSYAGQQHRVDIDLGRGRARSNYIKPVGDPRTRATSSPPAPRPASASSAIRRSSSCPATGSAARSMASGRSRTRSSTGPMSTTMTTGSGSGPGRARRAHRGPLSPCLPWSRPAPGPGLDLRDVPDAGSASTTS